MQVKENGDYEFLVGHATLTDAQVFVAAEPSKRKVPEKVDPPEYFLFPVCE